jgi:predicted ATPase
MTNQVYVITGGTFAGKTTTTEALGKLGHKTLPEAAMQVISDLIEKHGYENSLKWRAKNKALVQQLIGEAQYAQERSIYLSDKKVGPYFLDRGLLDAVAYCRILHVEPTDKLKKLARLAAAHYTTAFVLETLPKFDERDGSGRVCKRTDSEAARNAILQVYTEYGVKTYGIPSSPVGNRVNQIIELI